MRRWLIGNRFMVTLALTLLLTMAGADQATARAVELDIEAQPLAESLKSVAEVFDLQIAFFPEDAEDMQAPALAGRYTADEAFRTLLENTPLEHRYVDQDSVAIGPKRTAGEAREPEAGQEPRTDDSVEPDEPEPSQQERTPADEAQRELEEQEEAQQSAEEVAAQPPVRFTDEFVVTATRRPEFVQDIPMSVSAITRQKIEQEGIVSFVDYAVKIPNLSFAPSSDSAVPSSLSIAIRGVGGRGTTGFYIDDTPLPVGLNPRVIDVERIETLRGPQGTLFGARSMGGTVRLITAQPSTERFSGYVHASAGSITDGDESFLGDFGLNVPLSEDAALRLTGYAQSIGGFIDIEPTGGPWVSGDPRVPLLTETIENFNSHDVQGFQLASRFEFLDDRLTITPRIMYERSEYGGRTEVDVTDTSGLESRVNIRPFDLPELTEDEWWLGTLTLEYDWRLGRLTASSSWFDREIFDSEDAAIGDAAGMISGIPGVPLLPLLQYLNPAFPAFPETALSPALITFSRTQDSFTQEIRFASGWEGPFQLTAGLFYQEQNTSSVVPPTALPPIPAEVLDLFSQSAQVTVEEMAAFAEMNYSFTDRFRLIMGGRYYDNDVAITNFQGGTFGSGLTLSETQAEDGLIPRFGAQFDINDNQMLYATASEGYRIGGPNTLPLVVCGEDIIDAGLDPDNIQSYKSDSLKSYELGYKSDHSGGRLRFNTALFHTDWNDIQQLVAFPCAFGATLNIGAAQIRGGEAELNAFLGGGLSLALGAGYNDSEITDNSGYDDLLPLGSAIQDVPKWTFNGVLDWQFKVSEMPMFAYLSYSHVAESEGRYQTDVNRLREAYDLVNLRIGTYLGKGRYTVTLFVQNLTDEAADFGNKPPLAIDVPGLKRNTVVYPRTVGVDFRFNF